MKTWRFKVEMNEMNAYFLKSYFPKTYARPCSYSIRMNEPGNLHDVSHQQ